MATTEFRKRGITLDGNHHLAGQDLNLVIKLVEFLTR
jgi:FKBP-type peptidyl-prolyl cis-trans isomerase 2